MPFWFEMPYLEYFVDSAFPFSLEGGMGDTLIIASSKRNIHISTALTLAAYMGTKLFFSPYDLEFSSSINDKNKNKNIIFIGNSIPEELQQNFGFKIMNENIYAKMPILKEVFNGNILKKLFGFKEDNSKIADLDYLNRLSDQVFFMMGQSPFDNQKTVLILFSKNDNYLYTSVKNLFEPKFAGQIKGDISIWDFYQNIYYSDNVSKKYYIGNLPFWQKVVYTLGFSPNLFALFAIVVVVILSFALKKVLDYREKKRLEGEI
ncbi:MAG: cellulose biosynthesis cyclic di-GMP-binding regulatory protein BcsB [Hydrogenothermaceae bacterium]